MLAECPVFSTQFGNGARMHSTGPAGGRMRTVTMRVKEQGGLPRILR